MKGALINKNGIDVESLLKLKDISQSSDWVPDKTAMDVIKEVDADILVECSWVNKDTGEPAVSTLKAAMNKKMHIVSSNKGPFYLKYKELKEVADKNNVMMGMESTVLSAVPALAAKNTLAGTHIKSIRGILNGTCNYILWKMEHRGGEMSIILKDAQERGLAEADPSADIDGIDAAIKIVILANSLLQRQVYFEDVKRTGIRNITEEAFQIAAQKNETIRLIGSVTEDRLEVTPKIIPKSSSLNVPNTMNAVNLRFDIAKELTLSGYGAGGMETANAVVNDVYQIMKTREGK